MKKIMFVLLALISATPFLKADPAKKVNLTYNEENHILKIEALHPVKNLNDHYIDLISISVNGQEVKVLKPQKQSSTKSEIIEVEVPQIMKGCEVTVKTRCSEFGTKTGKLKI